MSMELDIAAHSLSEMMYLKRKQQQQQVGDQWAQCDAAIIPFKDQQLTLTPYDPAEEIQVGYFYEIDHSKLPHKFPYQLSPIRLVKVHEKTRMRVSLRFPSIYSLRTYFQLTNYHNSEVAHKTLSGAKKLPALDEKYMIGSEVAVKALCRKVTTEEILEKKSSWKFWSIILPMFSGLPDDDQYQYDTVAGTSLLAALQHPGMIKWGRRRTVKFLTKHSHEADEKKPDPHSIENAIVEGIRNIDSEDSKRKIKAMDDFSGKMEIMGSCNSQFCKRKLPKLVTKTTAMTIYDRRRKNNSTKKCIDRWSVERYNMAEVNMLKVMIENEAFIGNPILRPDLRNAARKLIGDTGLLDHLLKHMAGKVAPCGEMRFRRRHNANGAMEYWLEKADLIDIRIAAGVQDPFWIPPPGWQLGDSPSQDPVCARDIKAIKEDIGQLKKDMELLVLKKSKEERQLVTTPISSATGQTMEPESFLLPLKEKYMELVNKKAKIKEQLSDISHSLSAMEEELGMPKYGHPIIQNENDESKPEMNANTRELQVERLKSGFTICKPVGTFIWPDMVNSSTNFSASPSARPATINLNVPPDFPTAEFPSAGDAQSGIGRNSTSPESSCWINNNNNNNNTDENIG